MDDILLLGPRFPGQLDYLAILILPTNC